MRRRVREKPSLGEQIVNLLFEVERLKSKAAKAKRAAAIEALREEARGLSSEQLAGLIFVLQTRMGPHARALRLGSSAEATAALAVYRGEIGTGNYGCGCAFGEGDPDECQDCTPARLTEAGRAVLRSAVEGVPIEADAETVQGLVEIGLVEIAPALAGDDYEAVLTPAGEDARAAITEWEGGKGMKINLTVAVGNDGMLSASDVSQAIQKALVQRTESLFGPLQAGEAGGIMDENGNTVGRFEVVA